MRARYEFLLHRVDAESVDGDIEPVLALRGSQGWEIRGICTDATGNVIIALQRPLDEDIPLPDAPSLAATLKEPLVAPSLEDLTER